MTAPSDTPLLPDSELEKLAPVIADNLERWLKGEMAMSELKLRYSIRLLVSAYRRPRPPGEPPEDSAPRDEPAVHLLRQLLRIQKIASRYYGHTDLDAIYGIAYNTIRDFPLEREPDTRGEANPKDKLRAALWLMRRAIQRDDPVTLTPSEARALVALHGEKP